MGEKLVLLGDSAARMCTGLQAQYVSFHAQGLANRAELAADLDYVPDSDNYHQDKITEVDGCILAARIALTRGRADLVPCSTCANVEQINADSLVIQLRSGK